jgi:hypothetical protein
MVARFAEREQKPFIQLNVTDEKLLRAKAR